MAKHVGKILGIPAVVLQLFVYEGPDRFGEFDFSTPGDDRLAPFHQLDVSFIYSPTINAVDMELRLDLINLLDRRNTIDWSLRPASSGGGDQYEIQKRSMPGFHPSLSLQVNM